MFRSFISAARLTAVCFLFLTLLILSARSCACVVTRGSPSLGAFSFVIFFSIFLTIRSTVVRFRPMLLAMALLLLPCASPMQIWPLSTSETSEVLRFLVGDEAPDLERFRPTFLGPGLGSTLHTGGEVVPARRLRGVRGEFKDFSCIGLATNTTFCGFF